MRKLIFLQIEKEVYLKTMLLYMEYQQVDASSLFNMKTSIVINHTGFSSLWAHNYQGRTELESNSFLTVC